MRPPVDRDRLQALTEKLGRAIQIPTTVYLTGGATAVLEGWRASTVVVDVRFEPDSDSLLRRLPQLKEELQINIELASPPDFIPELPCWQERSPLVLESGTMQVRHFDPYSQALSKIERGFTQDLEDVTSMLRERPITPERLLELYEQIEPQLYRYPRDRSHRIPLKGRRCSRRVAADGFHRRGHVAAKGKPIYRRRPLSSPDRARPSRDHGGPEIPQNSGLRDRPADNTLRLATSAPSLHVAVAIAGAAVVVGIAVTAVSLRNAVVR